MRESKRVKRNVVTTNDISETGLTREQFQILSEHYENNENIMEDRDVPVFRVDASSNNNELVVSSMDTIIIKLSSNNNLNPRVVSKLLAEYETLKKESV